MSQTPAASEKQEDGESSVRIPEGLTFKNTFFDIPNAEDVHEPGPATCPPATEGWWPSSGSSGGGTPSIDSPSFASPLLGLPQRTPDWFNGDEFTQHSRASLRATPN